MPPDLSILKGDYLHDILEQPDTLRDTLAGMLEKEAATVARPWKKYQVPPPIHVRPNRAGSESNHLFCATPILEWRYPAYGRRVR